MKAREHETLEELVARIASPNPVAIEVDDPCLDCAHTFKTKKPDDCLHILAAWEPTDPPSETIRMTNVLPFHPTAQPTMTSREIAEMVEKRHDNVKRTIETLAEKGVISKPQIEVLEEISNLGQPIKREVYLFTADHKRDTYIVVAQLSPEFTARLVDRWQELEAGHAIPKVADPTLAAIVHSLVEIDVLKQRTLALDQKTNVLESRVKAVELQHRSGVPVGYLSKKQAYHLYGMGLSDEIFHLAMAKREVPIKNYIHRGEEGYEVATFAYLETAIPAAVEYLIADAVQVTGQLCQSPMLSGKRFRYVKESAA